MRDLVRVPALGVRVAGGARVERTLEGRVGRWGHLEEVGGLGGRRARLVDVTHHVDRVQPPPARRPGGASRFRNGYGRRSVSLLLIFSLGGSGDNKRALSAAMDCKSGVPVSVCAAVPGVRGFGRLAVPCNVILYVLGIVRLVRNDWLERFRLEQQVYFHALVPCPERANGTGP